MSIGKTAAFHTLGCKVNTYETEAMQQLLQSHGYRIVPFEEKADVYIVNTCTVTNIADRKSRQMLRRARGRNQKAVVVAAGCYVQAAGQELLEDGTIDILIGNNQKGSLVRILEEYWHEEGESFSGPKGAARWEKEDLLREAAYESLRISKTIGHTRAFIKVQDGCNQFCSYCIIPYARGRIRSRSAEDTEAEVKRLAENGCREIVLTGIHLSSYGLDFDTESRIPEAPFGNGLKKLILRLAEIPQIDRIRLGSLEPRIITEDFVEALASCEKLCPHFHLSLQSGCDSVLKRMNRHYTTKEYLNKCGLLRERFERPAITTDVIVGFPGETEEEFAATKAFVAEAAFYEMHVFPYSRRRKTAADRMDGQVAEPVKKERSHELLDLAQEMSEKYRESLLGKRVSVLLEEPEGEGYMAGYTKEYVRVRVPGGPELAGTQVHGKITCRNGDYILE
jgi:threonylcarbamoyladenosine tRNA methylthiotransferase MtaB